MRLAFLDARRLVRCAFFFSALMLAGFMLWRLLSPSRHGNDQGNRQQQAS